MTGTEILDAAVVGAGPYGLSVAAHARRRGSRARVFGTPMRAWAEHMPVGMKLKSEPWASHLSDPQGRYTLKAYCELNELPYAHGLPTPVETFVDYGRWFRRQTAVDVHESDVVRVDREGPVFTLELADGSAARARSVVLAAGFLPFPRFPEVLAGLGAPQVLHSSAVNDLSAFSGKRVTVIGGGQAAIEIAVLLDAAGADVTLVARAGALRWNSFPSNLSTTLWERIRQPESGLGPGYYNKVLSDLPILFRRLSAARRLNIVDNTLGPAGSWWIRERFEKSFDAERARTGTQVAAVRPEGGRLVLRLSGGGELAADHVIAATGFEVDVRKLTLLAEGLRGRVRGLRGAGGPPDLGAGFDSSVPGLHMVGLAAAATFGPSMRFVFGCAFASRTVAARLPR